MSGSRLSNEAKRAQYELPGFAAGVCISRLDHARRLLQAHEERYGRNALLRNVADTLAEIRESLVRWQMYAQMITDYELAHRATREEDD